MSGLVRLETGEISIGEADGVALVAIVRTGDLSRAVTIQYGITTDNATLNQDYRGTGGFVTMAPGEDRVLVPVTILNDTLAESTESFVVSIIDISSGSLIAPRTTRVSILDDENPVIDPPTPPLVSDYVVKQTPVISGLAQPIDFEFAPQNRDRMYVAEKQGMVYVYDTETGQRVSTFLDIRSQVNNAGDRGLLDIALHPDFPNNPYLYAFFVVDPPQSASATGDARQDGAGNRFAWVVRYEADAATDFTTVKAGSATILAGGAGRNLSDISGGGAVNSTSNFTQAPSDVNQATGEYRDNYIKLDSLSHAGGALAFGPDGALYVSIGDGTSYNATDPRTLSVQDVGSLSGKVLRIDPETGRGFADNPFFEPGMSLDSNEAKVYQLGLRNPFSMAFDDNGRLLITDTGWNSYEELNSGPAGANFGWPFFEGGDGGALTRTNGYKDLPQAAAFYAAVAAGTVEIAAPFRGFSHRDADPGFQFQAITGGNVFYDGDRYPDEFDGAYFFTDFSQGEVFAIDSNDRRDVKFLYSTGSFGPSHFSQGPDGLVYYADLVGGRIGKLEIGESTLTAKFFTPGAVTSLSQINFNATPAFQTTVGQINYPVTNGAFWPGGPIDGIAAQFTGSFTVATAGAHTFYLSSDDGSALYIDGQLVINHDGQHGTSEMSAVRTLTAGEHTIEVRYFESGGPGSLDLDWAGPGFARAQMQFVTFAPEAQGPDAVDDQRTTAANTSFWFNVLDNDLDRDGEGLTARLITGPTGGTVQFDSDGDVFYQPRAGFVGADRLVYEVVDANGATDRATFSITVGQAGNRAPDAVNDTRATAAGASFWFNVLENDTDPDGDALSARLISGPANGTVQFDSDGDVFYRPNAGFTGTDTIRYRAEDGKSAGDEAVFTIQVGDPTNRTPNAVNDVRATQVGASFWLNVLDNDTDADGDVLTTTLIQGPANAAAFQFDPDGDVFYRPNAGFVGTETIRYRVTDPDGATDTATLTITVGSPGNVAPDAVNDVRTTGAGVSFWLNVLDNDTDANGDVLTTTLLQGPANAAAFQFDADGDVFYQPRAGFTGTETIRYRAADPSGGTDTAVLTITVTGGAVAAAALVSADALVPTTLASEPGSGAATGSVQTNASMERMLLVGFGQDTGVSSSSDVALVETVWSDAPPSFDTLAPLEKPIDLFSDWIL